MPEPRLPTDVPRERAVAHVPRIGVAHRIPVFAQLVIAFHAISAFDRVPGSPQLDLPQLGAVDPPDTAATQSRGIARSYRDATVLLVAILRAGGRLRQRHQGEGDRCVLERPSDHGRPAR